MPDASGSLNRQAMRIACRGILIVACLIAGAGAAMAQQPGPQPLVGPDPQFGFLTRYDLQLGINVLSGNDGRDFRWDSHFGGEFDLINYVKGRATMVADYEAVLGSEFRPFDPNQGIYILEPAVSWFVGDNELSFVFHHVSRHLSDRPKTYAIAYNAALGRYLRKFILPDHTSLAVRASAGKVTQKSTVDYTWTIDWDVVARHPMNPYLELYARSTGEVFGVHPVGIPLRGTQYSTRLELGTRVIGRKADLELFLGAERRLDASAIEFLPVSWAIAGFRVVSK
jgi:hypothetical protein